MYKEYKSLNLPDIDKAILKFWEDEQIFDKSIDQRPTERSFVFYEGPPSANGKPGIHHVMARTVKDMFCRFHTMKGQRVERKGGWDTHGLPIELNVEKELGITKDDIGTKISIEDYNQKCRETVMRYKDMWDDLTRKMGYWVDLDNPYITFENEYIETVWWLLRRLYDKGLLYKGYTIQPYSPAAGTGLSSHELNMPGAYKEVKDTTVVAMFEVKKDDTSTFLFDDAKEDVRILAWTTTPWTLPSNTALTVGPKLDYVKIKTVNPYTDDPVSVVLAEALVPKWFGGKNQPEILEKSEPFPGAKLENIRYEQLLNFGNPIEPLQGKTDAFRVVTGNFVTTEDGTGIVHTAPSFGADDRRAGIENGIGALTLVDKSGKFLPTVGEFSNRYVKNYKDEEDFTPVDIDIAVRLKLDGKAFNVQKYEHNYPHCWRTDKPVLYYPLDSWFIKASVVKERMSELNKTINWKPKSTGEGRFGNWLDNLQDWNLSRSRFWGIPLPIWRTEDGEQEKCIGSIEELRTEIEKANKALGKEQAVPEDLHRPYIDNVILVSDDGHPMHRETDLIDVWFDSGSMPYAQWHYPAPSPKGETFSTSSEAENAVQQLYETANPAAYKILKENARNHRDNPTPAEEKLWEALRAKKLAGYKFRRQHVIGNFIVDFLCLRKRLVVEIDGGYHDQAEVAEADVLRTKALDLYGFQVIRFTNEEVLEHLEDVLQAIYQKLSHLPTFTKEELDENLHLTPPFGGAGGQKFPADFIAEGVDQTRGWFYTLHAIATMAFDSVAYKNVVSNGLVLDAEGNKMSKSKGNVVDPFMALEKYGSDPNRWYMMSNSNPWDNLKYDLKGVEEVRNKFFGTLYNTYSFFALYANIDKFEFKEDYIPLAERPEIDRWIISLLNTLSKDVEADYANYEPTPATRKIQAFVLDNLSNWYVRLCRRRFWKGDYSEDKIAAYQTLYECLETIAKLMAPVAPFFSDWLYQNLNNATNREAHESVHLSLFPTANEAVIDKALEERMDYAQRISSLVLSLRKKEQIRVRQPLQKIMLPVLDEDFKEQVEGVKDLILAEVNIKAIEYLDDTSGVIKKRIKPNFKTLGRRLGKDMKAAAQKIGSFSQEDIANLEKTGEYQLEVGDTTYDLTLEDFEINAEDIPGLLVANDGQLTVALDVNITPELEAEGMARELVNRIQNIRKNKDFEVTDRIQVQVQQHDSLAPAIEQFGDYIKTEVLADELELSETVNGESEEVELTDGVTVGIVVQRS